MEEAVASDTLSAKIVPDSEHLADSDFDTIDLSPAQGRKATGITWSELGVLIGDEAETYAWATDDDSESAESEPDTQPSDTELPLGATEIGRDLHELLDVSYLADNETYHWDGHSEAVVGSGTSTLALDGPASNYLVAFMAPPMNEFDATLVSTVVFDRTTGERIVARGVEALSFSDSTRIAIPEGEELAGHAGMLRAVVDGEFVNAYDSYNDALVSFEQRGEIVSLPFFAVDIGTGRVHDFADVATILGTDGADDLTDTAGNDTVVGGAGNDVLRTTTNDEFGYDFVYGGGGNDRFVFGAGSASGYGGQGQDSFYVGTGIFVANGQQGYDKVILDIDAADLIFTYMQGYTNDYYGITFTDGRTLGIIETIDEVVFGDKVWRVSEAGHADVGGYYKLVETDSGLKLSLVTRFEDLEHHQYIGDELVDGGTTMLGTTGSDVMTATLGDDLIAGGPGDDRITLVAGYDMVKAGAGDDFIWASSNDADAQNAAYGMGGDDTMDVADFTGSWVFFDGNEGHDTLLVSGGPQDYSVEQKSYDRVVYDDGGIGWESHELMLTKTGADGTLRTIQAGNIERVVFSGGTTWERADDSAELFPLV